MKIIKRIGLGLVLLLALATGGFALWAEFTVGVMDEVQVYLESTDEVTVTEYGQYLAFEPVTPATEALIFYPGARVEAEAYAPMAMTLASAGYDVFMVHFPLDMAILGSNRAQGIIEDHEEIESWYLGGHSLGGATASLFYEDHPQLIDGLIFLASYPVNSLASADLEVLSIYGTEDGLASLEEVEASKSTLPADSIYVPIEGGNHAQFGYYGLQGGDGQALISREAQQAQLNEAILDFLQKP